MHKVLKISGWARLALGVVLAAAFAAPAMAAGGQLDQIVDTYKNGSSGWEATLRSYALGLFAALVGIEVGFTALKLAFKGADLGEWLTELVNRIMFVGFFSALLTNSASWSRAIVDSFRQAGNAASAAGGGSGGVRPSDIFDAGISMAMTIMNTDTGVGIDAVAQKIGIVIAGLIIAVCFAFIAALLILALCESYLVVSAGVLFMGFGGSRWTKDFAVKAITYAVSVGAKLFVMQLIIGLGEAMVKSWAAGFQTGMDQEHVFVMIGSAIVLLALTKTIPEQVQGLISGVSPNGSGIMAAAAAAVGGAALGAVGAAAGAGTAMGGAARLASEQLKASDGAPSTGLGRGMALAGGTMKNLASAGAQDVGARLGGRAHHGTMAGRMGDRMNTRADEMSASRSKPSAPSANPSATSSPGAGQGGSGPQGSGSNPGGGSGGGTGAGSISGAGPAAEGEGSPMSAPVMPQAAEMAMAGGDGGNAAPSTVAGAGASGGATSTGSAMAGGEEGPAVASTIAGAPASEGGGPQAAPTSGVAGQGAGADAAARSSTTIQGAPASSGKASPASPALNPAAASALGQAAGPRVASSTAPQTLGGAPAPAQGQGGAISEPLTSGGATGTIRGAGPSGEGGSSSNASPPPSAPVQAGSPSASAPGKTAPAGGSAPPPAAQPPSLGSRLGGHMESPAASTPRTIRSAPKSNPNPGDAD